MDAYLLSNKVPYPKNNVARVIVSKELNRRTQSFVDHVRQDVLETAKTWLQAFTACWNQLIRAFLFIHIQRFKHHPINVGSVTPWKNTK